jgi:hypothetical protein
LTEREFEVNPKVNQLNAVSTVLNVCVTPQHKKFLHVSIYKEITIGEHKSNNTAQNTTKVCAEVPSNKMQTVFFTDASNGVLVHSINEAAHTLN